MALVHFTSWLRELVPDGPVQAEGATVVIIDIDEKSLAVVEDCAIALGAETALPELERLSGSEMRDQKYEIRNTR